MPDKPSNPFNFWQELKRRKVVRVITVYAAAAYVIIELISNIEEPLQLPDWTSAFIIVLLCIGFIITVILSWIYDITPEGIEKTKPANKVKEQVPEKPSGINVWKIATFISVIVISGLIIFNIFGRRGKAEGSAILDKSIAVLPFHNDSPDEENEYFINGTMEAILDNLCKIEDLRVVGRTSVEQYRNNPKPIPEIAKEMNVSYILEGSGQKYGNKVRLTLQLLDAVNDKHLWSSPYIREIEIEEIFTMQSEIAQMVAAEIEAVISPEEKQLIEKVPTTSLTAYDFYQRGREENEKFWLDRDNREALDRAELYYQKALEYDSTFAQAYTGLAWVHWNKRYWETIFKEDFLDSVVILAEKALSFDNQLSEAFVVKGNYYRVNNNKEQAINEYDKAIKYNPNDWMAYFQKGSLYAPYTDVVKAIENKHKAIGLHRGPFLSGMFRSLGFSYAGAGFKEKGFYYVTEALKLDHDSAIYFESLATIESSSARFEKSVEYAKKSYAIDSTNWWIIFLLGMDYGNLGEYEKSLEYYKKLQKNTNTLDQSDFTVIIRIGYAYWLNGFEEEAEVYFKRGWELYNEVVELDRFQVSNLYYYIAAYYAIMGDTVKAYEYLKLYCQVQSPPYYMIKDLTYDSLFDSIRDEPEFQQIIREVEAKYNAEHERVRQWLEENDML